jgi:choline dehydrogenase-like flavoprotein
VADASALPRIPRANTNAPVIMIGERCADFVHGELWIIFVTCRIAAIQFEHAFG